MKSFLSLLSTAVWTNSHKNRQIRRLFPNRIYGFISVLVQHLSRQIAFPVLAAFILVANQSQKGLDEFADSREDDDGESGGTSADSTAAEKKALIYARVSSHKQTSDEDDDEDGEDDNEGNDDEDDEPEEGSIQGQIDELRGLLEEEGLELATDPITDDAETGTDFDRPGIQQVFHMAQREDVGYLLVEKIDRIGRSAPETLYFIHVLQEKCNVRLITVSGERDLDSIHGLMHTTLLSLMAEVQNDIRTSKAKKERVRNFVQNQKWRSYSPIIPVGYTETEEGWLEPDPAEIDIVEDVFDEFLECEVYDETDRRISERYGDVLDGHRVKTLLTNPVYVGRPAIPEEWVVDLPYDNVVEDDDLAIIDEETFEKAQEVIEEKNEIHSTDSETMELTDFVERFDLFSVIASSDPATLLHDCGSPMIKNGQRTLSDGLRTHRYYCPECEEYRKWPKNYEYERMKLIHLLLDDDLTFLESVKQALPFDIE